METLEVRSRSIALRWITVQPGETLFWQVKPLKRTINVSLWRRRPDLGHENTQDDASSTTFLNDVDFNESLGTRASTRPISPMRISTGSIRHADGRLSVRDKMLAVGLQEIVGPEKCSSECGIVREHKFTESDAGMIALLFDNTYSYTQSKQVMFILTVSRDPSLRCNSSKGYLNDGTWSGWLLKKRRKKMQGWARRWVWVDRSVMSLCYSESNRTSTLRGEIPLRVAFVSAHKQRREFHIDSGTEIWNLRANNNSDFNYWFDAFQLIQNELSQRITAAESAETIGGSFWARFDRLVEQLEHFSLSSSSIDCRLLEIVEGFKDLQCLGSTQSLNQDDAVSFFTCNEINTRASLEIAKLDSSADELDYDGASLSASSQHDATNAPKTLQMSLEASQSKSSLEQYSLLPLPFETIKRRLTIPELKLTPPSLMSILRRSIGRDLSSLSVPIACNEPLTFLQRLAENMEYAELLNNASKHPKGSMRRLALVTAFAISSMSPMRQRERVHRKPFNPLLGETYELVREDKNFRYLSEKVVHRPLTVACHAEGPGWRYDFTIVSKSTFWGKSIELNSLGSVVITFADGQSFVYEEPPSYLRNVILGEKYVEPGGTLVVRTQIFAGNLPSVNRDIAIKLQTAECTFQDIKSATIRGRRAERVDAILKENGEEMAMIEGSWTQQLKLIFVNERQAYLDARPSPRPQYSASVYSEANSDTTTTDTLRDSAISEIYEQQSEQLWEVDELVADPDRHGGFTVFASQLNEVTAIEDGLLPCTDSRLRPDLRLYEEGDIVRAEKLKLELEQNQRDRRALHEDQSSAHVPCWFAEKDGAWVFKEGDDSYWRKRTQADFSDSPDLWNSHIAERRKANFRSKAHNRSDCLGAKKSTSNESLHNNADNTVAKRTAVPSAEVSFEISGPDAASKVLADEDGKALTGADIMKVPLEADAMELNSEAETARSDQETSYNSAMLSTRSQMNTV